MINWTDRKYINPRKRVFKNIETNEILNLELQEDLQNISQESETPLNAEMLNQAQQELKQDLINYMEQRFKNEEIISSIYEVTNKINGGTTFTIPIYYEVGNNSLEVIYEGEVLKKASNADTEGRYYEIGEVGSISNQIKLTSDWNADIGTWFKFKVNGRYISIEIYYWDAKKQRKVNLDEITTLTDNNIPYLNKSLLYDATTHKAETKLFCEVEDIEIIFTKDGEIIEFENGKVLEDGLYTIKIDRIKGGTAEKTFIIDTKEPDITGITHGDWVETAQTVTFNIDDIKILTIKRDGQTIATQDDFAEEKGTVNYQLVEDGTYTIYAEDHYGNGTITYTIDIWK